MSGSRSGPVAVALALALAACGGSATEVPASRATSAIAAASASDAAAFALTSVAVDGGRLTAAYRCERKVDGVEASIPLAWSGVPTGTNSLAIVMSHHPDPADPSKVSSYLLLWDIPPSVTSIAHGGAGNGPWHLGADKDGVAVSYTSPCSKGRGTHEYTVTLYALSSTPASLPDESSLAVTYDVLTRAIATVEVLGTASLTFTDTTP